VKLQRIVTKLLFYLLLLEFGMLMQFKNIILHSNKNENAMYTVSVVKRQTKVIFQKYIRVGSCSAEMSVKQHNRKTLQ